MTSTALPRAERVVVLLLSILIAVLLAPSADAQPRATGVLRLKAYGVRTGTGFLADILRGSLERPTRTRVLVTALHVVRHCSSIRIAEVPVACPRNRADLDEFLELDCDANAWVFPKLDLVIVPLSGPMSASELQPWQGLPALEFVRRARAYEIDLRGPISDFEAATTLRVPGPSSDVTRKLLCQDLQPFRLRSSPTLAQWYETFEERDLVDCRSDERVEECRDRLREHFLGSMDLDAQILVDDGGSSTGSSGSPVLVASESSRVVAVRFAGHPERHQGLSVVLDPDAVRLGATRRLSSAWDGFTPPQGAYAFEGEGELPGPRAFRFEADFGVGADLNADVQASLTVGVGWTFHRSRTWGVGVRVGAGILGRHRTRRYLSPDLQPLESAEDLTWEALAYGAVEWTAFPDPLFCVPVGVGVRVTAPVPGTTWSDAGASWGPYATVGLRWIRSTTRGLMLTVGFDMRRPDEVVYTGAGGAFTPRDAGPSLYALFGPRVEF